MLKVDHNKFVKTRDLTVDLDYIKQSNDLITDSLAKGCDVAEFGDGTIITTSVEVTEMRYIWDTKLRKMVKVSSRRDFI